MEIYDNVVIHSFQNEGNEWNFLKHVKIETKYVLVARSVTNLYGPFLDIKRSLTLLGAKDIFAVAGATRIMVTGHVKTPCLQAEITGTLI